jgi:hypothetical protein
MEISTIKIAAIAILKDGEIEAIVVQNGKPRFFETREMGNKEWEKLLEVDRANTT